MRGLIDLSAPELYVGAGYVVVGILVAAGLGLLFRWEPIPRGEVWMLTFMAALWPLLVFMVLILLAIDFGLGGIDQVKTSIREGRS